MTAYWNEDGSAWAQSACLQCNFVFAAKCLHDFDIRIGAESMSNVTEMPLCTHYIGQVGTGLAAHLSCDYGPMVGQFLMINIPGEMELLTLAEVEVYGGEYENPKKIASCKTK